MHFGLHVASSESGVLSGSFSAGIEKFTLKLYAASQTIPPTLTRPRMVSTFVSWIATTRPSSYQTVGSAPITATWYADTLKAESQPIDVENRQRAFALFPKAARALRAYTAEHPESEFQVAGLIEVLDYFINVEELHDIEGAPDASAKVRAAATAQYSHKVTIKKKRSNINLPRREYEHSALILQIYKQNGALLSSWHTSNHGTAATSSSMSTKCSKTFTKTNVSFNVWDIMCESYRSVWPVQHLCNDDTRQEYYRSRTPRQRTGASARDSGCTRQNATSS